MPRKIETVPDLLIWLLNTLNKKCPDFVATKAHAAFLKNLVKYVGSVSYVDVAEPNPRVFYNLTMDMLALPAGYHKKATINLQAFLLAQETWRQLCIGEEVWDFKLFLDLAMLLDVGSHFMVMNDDNKAILVRSDEFLTRSYDLTIDVIFQGPGSEKTGSAQGEA